MLNWIIKLRSHSPRAWSDGPRILVSVCGLYVALAQDQGDVLGPPTRPVVTIAGRAPGHGPRRGRGRVTYYIETRRRRRSGRGSRAAALAPGGSVVYVRGFSGTPDIRYNRQIVQERLASVTEKLRRA